MSAIRSARPEEAGLLTDLAVRSKAHWGYDARFMEIAARELVVTPEEIDAGAFGVLEEDVRVVGFYGLLGRPPALRLEYLFVAPDRIGGGLGRRLWEHAVATARALRAERIELEAEPNAEPFYRRLGAERTGEVVAPSTGRRLPHMRLRL